LPSESFRMNPQSSIPLEREATLLICSNRPEAVYREIASLTAVRQYRLIPGEPQLLEDHYFDTATGQLTAGKWGLRLRKIGKDYWITLKGPAKETQWGGRERVEIEAPWSKAALAVVEKELSQKGLKVDFQNVDLERSDPLEIMIRAGFVVIQRRNTARVASAVISGSDGQVQAELAADSVAYFFGETEIIHYEIEIETKGPKGIDAAEAIAGYLLSRYSHELKRWHHDKLATGLAVRELLIRGSSEALLDPNNRLKPAAYDRIDEYLGHKLG
jgi:inorganic triphosphatase YgiF